MPSSQLQVAPPAAVGGKYFGQSTLESHPTGSIVQKFMALVTGYGLCAHSPC